MDFELTIFGLAKKWRYLNKVLGLVSAGLLIAFGILSFSLSGEINYVVLQIYYFVFALLLLLGECGFKATTRMFGFLGNLFGKGLFVILIGMSMFIGKFDFRSIIAVVLIICGTIYLVLFFIPRRITNDAGAGYADGQR
jgi:COPI associated protein